MLAAGRAGNVLLLDERLQLLVRPAVRLDVLAVRLRPILDELIRAETRLARLAVHQRVVEVADVSAGDPNLTVHQNRAVDADVVLVLLNEFLPPRTLDVVLEFNAQRAVLEFNAQRAVVPRVRQAAVDFRAGEHEAASLAQRNELVHHVVLHLCHGKPFFLSSFRGKTKNRAKTPPRIRACAWIQGTKDFLPRFHPCWHVKKACPL